MRILLDDNLSASIVGQLRDRGVDAIHTGSVGLSTAADVAILKWCRREGCVAFTRDTDFHAILARTGDTAPSVVSIRIEPISEREFIRILEWIVREKREELDRGVAMTVKATSIRTRHLPLIPSEDPGV